MNRLAEIRAERKMSKREMAKSLGVAYTTYCGWESGDRDLNSEKLSWLSSRLDVSVDYLVGRSDIRKPVTTKDDGQEEKYEEIRQIFDELNLENAESLRDYALYLLQRQKSQDVQ